ncbi:DsbA family protein [Actinophytocola oryzae]|uniref:Protein-disulfide isomerase n=1 Tax=Actinophytocola oryzae TaxID=502181 RepID=A0A4R7V0Z7_9PSEU|nr:thioredoxin domain-containing protein [Actinophytocola oryzae]TDV42142.1 protein-disulfide isomerase [Actinophytocola oryzae]
MGGAQRNARKKRQAQGRGGGSKAVAAARRGDNDRRKVIVGVGVVVVLLAAVIGGVIIYNNQKNTTEGQNIKAIAPDSSQQAATAEFPVTRDGGVVVVGQTDAKVTLDVYEDFLCPICGEFEKTYGADIEKNVAAGSVQVRYHMLPLLNDRSDPPGYSTDSANAGLCAADAGQFPAFHQSLYNDQPEEGSRGWDDQQLAKLGADLGIKDVTFKSCVTSGKYDSLVSTNYEEVSKTPYLQQDLGNGQKGFGTPTVAVGQQVVDTSESNWLDNLVKSAS